MKKLLIILAVTGIMIACQNNTSEKDRNADSLRVADSIRKADSIRNLNEPAQYMPPLDTSGRRPRD